VADWTFRRATAASLDVTGGLRLELTGDDAAMTSPTINVDPQAATWIRIKLIPGTTPLQPYVQWRTAAAGFSEARKVAFEIPAGATPGVPIDVDVPIHQLALGGDNITRLRVGFGNTGSGEVTILRVFTAVDTRHNVNNANFLLAAATYFNWTDDVDFLRDYIGTLRRIFRYSVEEFGVRTHGVVSTPWAGKDGRSGLTLGPGGSKTINHGLGVGNNYWDLLPFGGKDAYATVYHFAATRAMEQLEAAIAARPEWNIPAPAADYGAARLAADLEQIRGASAQTFWKADKGRFGAAVDSTGKLWDYGFTFLNNEAMYYGLTTPAQERQIVDWLSGTRSIAGETATGSDLYRWRFGPRATTVRNVDYYNHAWTGPETLPFGGQVQDGGAVFGFSFHDLMGRLRVNGPDDAWARLKEILAWFGEVQAEGGYRRYYTAETADERGSLQGGGTAGGLGVDEEFYETLLVPLIMTEGFLGLSVTPERVRFAPQLPQEWPSLEVGRIQYRDWMLRAKATPYEFELDLEAGGTAGPIEVELGAGRWDVQVLDAQNQVLATAAAGEQEGTTLTIDDPASKRLVATRAPELNVWLLAVSGDWNTATNWHLGVVPGGTYAPLLNNGGTAYLATNAPVLSGAAFIGQGAGDGTLEIRSGGSLALGQLLLGRDSGRTGTLVVDGGTLAVAEVLHVGDGGDGTGGYGNVQVVSGLLDAGTAGIRLGGNGGAGVTGSFVLSGGALQAADLVVRAGSSFSDRGGTIDVAATITNHGTWTLDPPTALTRSYNLAGTGAVTKSGTGTMTLTGTNAGTGVTIVESGRLVIDGNHSAATGDVIVRSGAALGGRGTLGGNLVLEAGARWVLATQSALTVTGTVSGGFTLAQVEGLDAGSPVGRYPLINGTVDPSQFSPVGPAAAQDIGGGHLAWFEAGGGSLTLVVASATPSFGGWLQQNGLQGPAADPLAAPAGDGIVNLLKYAFNLDPLRHEGNGQYPGEFRGLPYLESAVAGDLHLIYYRDPAKTDIRVAPVWRRDLNDLSGWSEIDVNNRQLLGTQDGIEQWRARLPIEGNQGFMSIQVEIE
jgi:autotransporter-associated beta strand protein